MSEAEHTGVLLDGHYRVQTRLGQGGIKFLRADIARKPGAVKRFGGRVSE